MAFSNSVINGGDILLYIEDHIIGCATTHTIELTNTVREVSCKGSGDFTSSEYGRYSWTASTDALLNLGMSANYVQYDDLYSFMVSKQYVKVKSLYEENSDVFLIQGEAIITSISLTTPDAENASYSVSLQGRGELTVQTGVKLNPPVLTAATPGDTVVDLTWDDTNTTPNETGIKVEYRQGLTDWTVVDTVPADTTTYQVTGLQNDTEADFRLTAVGDGGANLDSNVSNLMSATPTAP
jgi:predicted secreted protein